VSTKTLLENILARLDDIDLAIAFLDHPSAPSQPDLNETVRRLVMEHIKNYHGVAHDAISLSEAAQDEKVGGTK